MFDFHSHVLPGLDDGARDIRMSMEMLRMSYRQGVRRILASPHYYADQLDIKQALRAREASYSDVIMHAQSKGIVIPEIFLGFEVKLSKALFDMDIRPLCIKGTNTMLVEMPYGEWPKRVFDVLDYISIDCKITVLLAHVERYLDMVSSEMFSSLMERGHFAQVNANSFIDRNLTKRIDEMIVDGKVHVLGSDAHNMLRCSLMDVAYNHVRKVLGEKQIARIQENEKLLMGETKENSILF